MTSSYDPKLFEGAARDYARFRFSYPKEMFDFIVETFPPGRSSQALDLGCGTGLLAIPLSNHYSKIVCMDPSFEMLTEAKILAHKKEIMNLEMSQSSSWDLPDISSDTFQLVTLGQSFHWMDRHQTLKDIYDILVELGGLVIVTRKTEYPDGFRDIIDTVVKRFLGEKRRAGSGHYTHPSETDESLLQASPLYVHDPWNHTYEMPSNITNLIGFLHSTSYAARYHLGSAVDEFDDAIRNSIFSLHGKEEFVVSLTVTVLPAQKKY